MANITKKIDEIVDIDSLLKLKPLIEYGIVKNWGKTRPTNFAGKIHFKDTTLLSMGDYENLALENPEQFGDPVFIKKLQEEALLGPYLRYNTDMHYSGFALGLRVSGYKDKHIQEKVTITEADKDFQELHSWIKTQDIFESYGRVIIWVHEPGSKILLHRDSVPNSKLDEFVWIRFDDRKKLYVETEDKKYYLDGYVNWFDTTYYHSSDICEKAAYSIRIDGIFTQKIKQFLEM